MTTTSLSRMVVPSMAFVAACGVALFFAIQHVRREPPVDVKAASAAPASSKPASDARDQGPAALTAAQAKATVVAAALAGPPVPPD
ncbi:MAG: DedD protein, partial [Bradyrhizobium sp.]